MIFRIRSRCARQLVPIDRPSRVSAVGRNKREHAAEACRSPSGLCLFARLTGSIVGIRSGPAAPSNRTEWIGRWELGVIGGRAWAVPEAGALDYAAGYPVGSDMSARDMQMRERVDAHEVVRHIRRPLVRGPETGQSLRPRLHAEGRRRVSTGPSSANSPGVPS